MNKDTLHTSEPTHDALCPKNNPVNYQREQATCQCELIARVRKDEHDKALLSSLDYLLDNGNVTAQLGYKKALIDTINSIKTSYMSESVAVRSQTEWGVELALTAITSLEGAK